MERESSPDLPAQGAIAHTHDLKWKAALDAVVPCTLVLKVTLCRAVDTEAASSSYATGFIVDKSRGIILTNRHVISPGPIVAEAIFLNREELPVYPLYFDPVHDFAFFRFDPSKVQFMEVNEVPLAPEAASVGLDIRVVGNDSGEKVSILAGVLARLDRDAPTYGRKGYNDFNTFYLQAASGTKGGSSGSPVIDCHGRAVGLNAGGRSKAASAYYLPLERVVRALKLIQASKDLSSPVDAWSVPQIPRGDLQTTFAFKGFDEVRRLGLRQETERAVRAAPARTHGRVEPGDDKLCTTTGMLVVDMVLPGGPADGVLEAGDVLVQVNGEVVTHFLHLEEILDAHVGKEVALCVDRGGLSLDVRLIVADIHDVTPASFLEVSGGTVHALSYQQARNNRVVPGQVYVAESGYMLGRAAVPKHAIITALNNVPTPTLEAFGGVLRGLQHRARVPLEYYTFQERHRRKNAIMHMDREWYGPPTYWIRDDARGCWHPISDWPSLPSDRVPEPQTPILSSPICKQSSLPEPPAVSFTVDDPLCGPNGNHQQPQQHDDAPMQVDAAGVAEAGVPRHTRRGGNSKPTPKSRLAKTAPVSPATPASPVRSPKTLPAAAADDVVGEEAQEGLAVSGGDMLDRKLQDKLRCSLVLVDVNIPLVALTDGVHARQFAGNGLVVHHSDKVGLVLVDRNTVAVGPCDVTLSFGAHPTEAPGTVRFLHPLLNFALVSYDPQQLPEEARRKVCAAEVLCNPPLHRGDTVYLAGLTKFLRIMQRKSIVTTATSAVTIPMPEVPRFRAVHEEVIKLDQDFGTTFSGVLTDEAGRVRALWGSYAEQVDKEEREWCSGLPADAFEPWVQRLLNCDALAPPPRVMTLDAELEPLLLSKASQFNLPTDWVTKLDRLDPERRQVLRVRSTLANSHASQVLRSGDMVLAISGKPVTCFRDVEAIIATHNGDNATHAVHDDCDTSNTHSPTQRPDGSSSKKRKAVSARAMSPMKARQQRSRVASTSSPSETREHSATVKRTPTKETLAAVQLTGKQLQQGAASAALSPVKSRRGPAVSGPVTGTDLAEIEIDTPVVTDMVMDVTDSDGVSDGLRVPKAVEVVGCDAPTSPMNCKAEAVTVLDKAPVVPITIFRGGQIQEVSVSLGCEDGMGTNRIVHWCGAQLQAPHRAVRELGYLPETAGVYVSRWHHGSPAQRYGLFALHWISEVNGQPTPDLDTFLQVVHALKHGDFVRIKVCHLETAQPKVLSLKMDLIYWPTWELTLQRETCAWKRRTLDSNECTTGADAAVVP